MLSWYISTDTDAASCPALRNLRKAVSEQKTETARQAERAKVARDAAADGSSKATAAQSKVEALLSSTRIHAQRECRGEKAKGARVREGAAGSSRHSISRVYVLVKQVN